MRLWDESAQRPGLFALQATSRSNNTYCYEFWPVHPLLAVWSSALGLETLSLDHIYPGRHRRHRSRTASESRPNPSNLVGRLLVVEFESRLDNPVLLEQGGGLSN